MTTTTGRKVIFYLNDDIVEKADKIAEKMSREFGEPVSRSAAVRRLIDRFFVTECSPDRTMTADTDKAA